MTLGPVALEWLVKVAMAAVAVSPVVLLILLVRDLKERKLW